MCLCASVRVCVFVSVYVSVCTADFWKAEEKWQEEELAAGFVVDITDHRTEGTRFKSWVTYNVVSPLSTAGVRRRYSDFEWLRELLKLRFHGESAPGCAVRR